MRLLIQYLFKYFRYYWENTNWSKVVLFLVSATFIKNCGNIGLFQQRRKL